MTYQELQDEVETNIIDLPAAVLAKVPTYVLRAVKTLQTKHNFKVMETEQTYNTVLSTRSIGSVPSNFKEWRLDPFFLDDEGVWRKIILAPNVSAIRQSHIDDEDIGYPLFLLESDASNDANASTLLVYPLPDGNSDFDDGEYRIYVPYVKYLTALSAGGDSNWFTINADEYIINLATSYGFAADWDEQRMGIWAQLAENKFKEIVKRDKLYRLSGVDTLVPHYQGVNEARTRM